MPNLFTLMDFRVDIVFKHERGVVGVVESTANKVASMKFEDVLKIRDLEFSKYRRYDLFYIGDYGETEASNDDKWKTTVKGPLPLETPVIYLILKPPLVSPATGNWFPS